MSNLKHRTPIPWVHKQNPLVTSWVWETDHFIVTIYAEGISHKKMFNWKINDKSHGVPVPFDSSDAASFNASVEAALEVIGKSYPRNLGYQEYAGSLATTFKLNDGRSLDLSSLIGETVSLVAQNDSDLHEDILLTGMLDIEHYDVTIRTGESTVARVTPSYIKDIRREFGMTSALDELGNSVKASKNRRIFYEEWRRGCTGKPGFNAGTVEHTPNDPFCPIHNI